MDWPEGDESGCFRLADACAAAARLVVNGGPAGRSRGGVGANPPEWDGEALKAFAAHVRQVYGGREADLVQRLVAAAIEFNRLGVQVQYTKRMIEVSVCLFVAQLAWLLAAAMGPWGGISFALIGSRVVLARLTVAQIARRLLINIAIFGGLVGGMDLAVQATQSRRDEVDWDQVLASAGTGALTGAFLTATSGFLSRLATPGLRLGMTPAEMSMFEKVLAASSKSVWGLMGQSGMANAAATAVSLGISGQFDWETVLKGGTAGVLGGADAHWAGWDPSWRSSPSTPRFSEGVSDPSAGPMADPSRHSPGLTSDASAVPMVDPAVRASGEPSGRMLEHPPTDGSGATSLAHAVSDEGPAGPGTSRPESATSPDAGTSRPGNDAGRPPGESARPEGAATRPQGAVRPVAETGGDGVPVSRTAAQRQGRADAPSGGPRSADPRPSDHADTSSMPTARPDIDSLINRPLGEDGAGPRSGTDQAPHSDPADSSATGAGVDVGAPGARGMGGEGRPGPLVREAPDAAIADGFAAIVEKTAERDLLVQLGRQQEADALSFQLNDLLDQMARLVPDEGERAFYEHHAEVRKSIELVAEEAGLSADAVTEIMRAELVQLLDDRPVAVRISAENLLKVLEDGRFKSQFEVGRSRGVYYPSIRAGFEQMWFGYPMDSPAHTRPIYGFVNVLADSGANRYAVQGGRIEHYGDAQVTLRPEVRARTTVCMGDSLKEREGTMPSPLTDPRAESFGAFPHNADMPYIAPTLRGTGRDYAHPSFWERAYVEAQIHGGVAVTDIEHVMFESPPPSDVRQALDAAGIPWGHLNETRSE